MSNLIMPAYAPYMCEAVREMMSFGGRLKDVAKVLGIDKATLVNWRKQHPEFDAAIKEGLAYSDNWKEDEQNMCNLDIEKEGDQMELPVKVKKPSKRQMKQFAIKKAQFYTNSTKMAVLTTVHMTGGLNNSPDASVLHDELNKQIKQVLHGDLSGIETMLMAQAKTLEFIFNDMIMASQTSNFDSGRHHMDMAMRAQNQCRKTLLALATIKNPPQKQIVEQQNIAVNQQVNNGVFSNTSLKPELQKIKLENELLSETTHEALDYRGTQETIRINSPLETVEISRRKNSER